MDTTLADAAEAARVRVYPIDLLCRLRRSLPVLVCNVNKFTGDCWRGEYAAWSRVLGSFFRGGVGRTRQDIAWSLGTKRVHFGERQLIGLTRL